MSPLPDVSLGGPAESRPVQPDREVSCDVQDEPLAPEPQEPPAGAAVEQVAVELPDTDLGGARMAGLERAWVLVCCWVRQGQEAVREMLDRPGGLAGVQPESLAQWRAYVRSKAWLPEGYEDGWLVRIPVAFYNTLGWFGVVTGYGWAWLFKRMFRFNVAVVVVVVVVVLWLCFGGGEPRHPTKH